MKTLSLPSGPSVGHPYVLLLMLGVLLTAVTGEAQISVGVLGAGPLTFNATPLATEFATSVLVGGAATYTSATAVDTGVQTINAANVVRRLPTDANVPPVSFSGGFRHNTTGFYLQSRPTTDNTNAASVMVAFLQNGSGNSIASFTVSYGFALYNPNSGGEIPGYRVFYSTTGLPGNWQLIPALSSTDVAGTHVADIAAGSWPPGAPRYLLWADDNANSITDPSYTIDDFMIGNVVFEAVPDTCVGFTNQPSSLTVGERASASFTIGATGSPQYIEWYQNGVLIPGVNGNRYTVDSVLYASHNGAQIHATVSNSICIATSAVAILTVIADTNPPVAVSAVGDILLDTVRVNFSEPIEDTGNLESEFIVFPTGSEVQGGQELITTGYALTNGNRTVVLTVNPPREFGTNYSVYITGIADVSSARNGMQPNPTVLPIASTVLLIGFDTANDWKYSLGHTAASNLHGTGWEQDDYNDSAWPSGVAGLGRDTGQPNGVPIRTMLPYTSDPATLLNVTTYFRRRFHLPSGSSGVTLALRDVVEDGAVYYLNGVEVLRNRMPGGTITFVTETESATEPQGISGPFNVPTAALRPGTNVLAAEVHQNGPDSSDMEFAAELIATIPAFTALVGPRLNVALDRLLGTITISWAGGGVLQESSVLISGGTIWTDVPGNPDRYSFTPDPGTQRFFRLRP